MELSSLKKQIKDKDYIKTFTCTLNPQDNGGEAIILEVDVYKNDDGERYTDTHIKTQCYGTFQNTLSFFSVCHTSLLKALQLIEDGIQKDFAKKL
jgi:hypothetical protein